MNDWLIKQMYTQCKLDKPQFMNLARCPMSLEAYQEVLRQKGLID